MKHAPVTLLAAIALAACAGTGSSESITTPEGAVIDADPDLAYAPSALSREQLEASTRDLFVANFMNVFRRFDPAVTDDMVRFYTGALGLRSLSPIQLTATQQMILTGVGGGQIKLSAGLPESRSYALGGAAAGTGIRFFGLAYPDEGSLRARFIEHGFTPPEFTDDGDTISAMVMDPGGFPIELVLDHEALPNGDSGVDVGINTANLEASRAFYRSFVGLTEEPPYHDSQLGVTVYPFRNGETRILLFHTGAADLPNDNGSAGIQYIVGDAAMVDARAKHRSIPVQTPLNRLAGFDLTTIWLSDPDGVTNYFAQVGPRRSRD